LLLHLPEHVRRFGPAILFATESFESYNAIIRGWSIHSNRQAPSRDIANAASYYKSIRHLASGGFFDANHTLELPSKASPDTQPPHTTENWVTVGPGPLHLLAHSPVISKRIGIDKRVAPIPGELIMI
jgi:hypothetical protein